MRRAVLVAIVAGVLAGLVTVVLVAFDGLPPAAAAVVSCLAVILAVAMAALL